MKKGTQLLIGCAISGAMLYFAFKDIDFAKVGESLAGVRLWPIVPFLIFAAIHLFMRSLRWRYLLPPVEGPQVPVRTLFDAFMLGSFSSLVLPGRVGEFIRPLILSRWSSYSFGSSFISVVIERFFDLSAVLLSFALIATLPLPLPEWASIAAYSLGGMALCLLLFMLASCVMPSWIRSVVAFFLKPLPAGVSKILGKFLNDLVDGAAVIKTPARMFAIVGLTAIIWATAYLQFWAVLLMFPEQPSLLLMSVAVGVFVALAIAIPSMPGFVGVWQLGCVEACKLFAYPEADAQAFSLVSHFISYVIPVGIGFWLLTLHGMSFADLKKTANQNA
jgi:uncharacterized protein (TIRG00374 family)